MQRYLCVHGHFYQPPREDPWLEAVLVEDSAYPYHDWNERVTAECYSPNAAARLLDGQGRIERIVNSYARISFDFGPTLLAWLERAAPEVYQAVLEGDRESQQRYGGHGSALAHAYNHVIMPLASGRDKRTQVLWGIRDFERRFRRRPEGMWLPETAVDLATLEVMAEQGIAFTVLEPAQAGAVRSLGGGPWQDAGAGRLNTSGPYLQCLPSGRSIALFFFHGPLSQAVAFEGLLQDGEALARRLVGAFSSEQEGPQLVHIATDGESYGHHHKFGDMALAYALDHVEQGGLARLTNYGQYLALHPAVWEVRIREGTSWSCPHGVERWRSGCGCNTGAFPGWSQAWRAPLREALDWLQDAVEAGYEAAAGRLLRDPWAARDDYIEVVLDRSPESVEAFLALHALQSLTREERVTALKLLELQRHAMLMFTSCGWFFDDPSRLETVQVLRYAARVVQLARELFGQDMEPAFLERLGAVKSNVPEHGDGARIYQWSVKPSALNWDRVAAHFAVSSLLDGHGAEARRYCYTSRWEEYRAVATGGARLAMGRGSFTSAITEERARRDFALLLLPDHQVNGVAGKVQGDYQAAQREMEAAFLGGDLHRVHALMEEWFDGAACSLASLFPDERRAALRQVLDDHVGEAEAFYRALHREQARSARHLIGLKTPVPRDFQLLAEMYLNMALRRAAAAPRVGRKEVVGLVQDAMAVGAELDTAGLGYSLGQRLREAVAGLDLAQTDLARLVLVEDMVALSLELPFPVFVGDAQTAYYRLLHGLPPSLTGVAQGGDRVAAAWAARFLDLGRRLGFAL
ncbi:MAG: DUF3536 domain-containing protein [Chloroflexi bacterium]|nr:DUF3536 domain-containing protein [Chloroflexota bacterium]